MNKEIILAAKAKEVDLWEVARLLGTDEDELSRKLYTEQLSPKERDRILWVIGDIAQQHDEASETTFAGWLLSNFDAYKSYDATGRDNYHDGVKDHRMYACAQDLLKCIRDSKEPRKLMGLDDFFAAIAEAWQDYAGEETDVQDA